MSDSMPQACLEADRQLVAFACDDAGDVPSSVRAHLETCPRCSAELKALRQTRKTFQQLPLEEPSSGMDDGIFAALDAHFAEPAAPAAPDRQAKILPLAARRPRRWLGPAMAAAASLVVVSGTAWYLSVQAPERAPAVASATPTAGAALASGEKNAEATKPLLAMNEPHAPPVALAGAVAEQQVVDKAAQDDRGPTPARKGSEKKDAQLQPLAGFGDSGARRDTAAPAKALHAAPSPSQGLAMLSGSGSAGGGGRTGSAKSPPPRSTALALNDSFASDSAAASLEQQAQGSGEAAPEAPRPMAAPAAPRAMAAPPPPPDDSRSTNLAEVPVTKAPAEAPPAVAALSPTPATDAPRGQVADAEEGVASDRDWAPRQKKAKRASKEEAETADESEQKPRPLAPLWERDLEHARSAARGGDHVAAADFYARVLRLEFLPSNIEEEAMSGRVHELLALGRLEEAQAATEMLATRHPKSAALREVARKRATMAPAAAAPAAVTPPPAAMPAATDSK